MIKADEQKKEVGQRIQACRKAQGMTRKVLANKMGDDNTDRLEDWEQGKTLPRVLDFISLAEALNTTTSELQAVSLQGNEMEKSEQRFRLTCRSELTGLR